eukprot:15457959-Alexandrium_andersonii.AAC.2
MHGGTITLRASSTPSSRTKVTSMLCAKNSTTPFPGERLGYAWEYSAKDTARHLPGTSGCGMMYLACWCKSLWHDPNLSTKGVAS